MQPREGRLKYIVQQVKCSGAICRVIKTNMRNQQDSVLHPADCLNYDCSCRVPLASETLWFFVPFVSS